MIPLNNPTPVIPDEIMKYHERVTGKQLYKLILDIVRAAPAEQKMSKLTFCKLAGIHRSSVHRFRQGEKPSLESVVKVLRGAFMIGSTVRIKL